MAEELGEYEYAGFRYRVTMINRVIFMAACPGQHSAASKDKHLRAALQCWYQDHPYHAEPCGCGHVTCKNWHVTPVAAVQGVGFTKEQAMAVAELLNLRKRSGHDKEA